MIVPDRVRLPLQVDAVALAGEALALSADDWVPHFNREVYEGSWSGVALRSVGGRARQIYPDPAPREPFADTETLGRCPEHTRFLAQLGCPVLAARLLALAPGSVIKEHRDHRLGWDDGEIRVHVPLVTDDEVEFVLDGRSVQLVAGEAWYLDLNRPHRASNRSTVRRIHLVVDLVVDDWLSELMRQALAARSSPVSSMAAN